MHIDILIQKYLTNKTTPEEKEYLLDQLLKFYNQLIMYLENFRQGTDRVSDKRLYDPSESETNEPE